MTTNLTPELQEQIEQEGKSKASDFGYDPGAEEYDDLHSQYVIGASIYARHWQEEKELRERYEKALKEILNTNHDNYEKVIMKVKQIANEALASKTNTDDTANG